MDKQIMVLTNNEIFFSHKRNEVLVDATIMDEPQKHLCQVKETRLKGHLVFYSILYETFRISQSTGDW